ncbi:pyridoxal-phosphate dependent enzyme [Allomuricauda taeanensis]|uniref:1-aminocyclopropane-1-carboxylate deaminase/D-cysteine desulfhydrase n=1 Tax=Flagellimonas taeanensis TaxID=1005926 RepID=UPI002E7AB7D8|nr:pyridoxal-phosphate dependent enzyme [Allomuricauda taeanensis]MEE1963188.1 pyridoxal-phosphate dependent enzyme [Allomuricauda taeanensis]
MIIDTIENQIFVVRDDLYPSLGSGNKGRKMDQIGAQLLKNGHDAIVTTGGIQSNHCRATAIFAAKHKISCTLVVHGNEARFRKEGGNAKLMRDAKARMVFPATDDISRAMDAAMEAYTADGYNPYYLRGGGHTLEGGLAYVNAIDELLAHSNILPDYIFLASGTGSTQAGIMAGLAKNKVNCDVIGISVARERKRAENIVYSSYLELCGHLEIDPGLQKKATVLDDYLCGGYEKFGPSIKEVSNTSIPKYGFPLDTTYTGKAFYGMLDYVGTNRLKGNLFFWHTGGFLNYLANV